jgi:hypothetical protein
LTGIYLLRIFAPSTNQNRWSLPVPHSKPTKTVAEAFADLARLNDPAAYEGHAEARMKAWQVAKDTISRAKRPGFLIIANDNTGDAA